MKKIKVILLLSLTCIILTGFINHLSGKLTIVYPEGYRNWTHVKSNLVGAASPAAPKYEGFTHIYANAKAMQGYRTGNFPNGSVIVFDVIESQTIKTGIKEGNRKFIDVMVKDSTLYASTGGWGYEEFDKSSKAPGVLKETDKANCYKCHTSRKDNGYVFSSYRE